MSRRTAHRLIALLWTGILLVAACAAAAAQGLKPPDEQPAPAAKSIGVQAPQLLRKVIAAFVTKPEPKVLLAESPAPGLVAPSVPPPTPQPDPAPAPTPTPAPVEPPPPDDEWTAAARAAFKARKAAHEARADADAAQAIADGAKKKADLADADAVSKLEALKDKIESEQATFGGDEPKPSSRRESPEAQKLDFYGTLHKACKGLVDRNAKGDAYAVSGSLQAVVNDPTIESTAELLVDSDKNPIEVAVARALHQYYTAEWKVIISRLRTMLAADQAGGLDQLNRDLQKSSDAFNDFSHGR